MAQRKQLTWSELRVGIFVLVGLVILGTAILWVTGAGFLGPKYQLRTYLPEVEGLQAGAPVDLDGVQVGNVSRVRLTANPSQRSQNVTLVLRIEKKYQHDIRTDSVASLETEGLLGNRYVSITRGITGTVIPDNGVVQGHPEQGLNAMVQRGTVLMENLNELSTDLRSTVNKIQNGHGTFGKLINDPALYNHLDDTVTRLDAVATSVQEGKGSLGKLVTSDDLYRKVDATADRLEDATAAIQNQKGTLGKLIYDPDAYNDLKGMAHSGNALLTGIQEGKGTLGKLATDDQLYTNLRDATANLRDVTGKLNNGQGTMGQFMTNPQLYDNLTGLSGDMRLLINDFRKNPKKFLRIKLGLF